MEQTPYSRTPVLKLIGEELEIFYQLGQKDRDKYSAGLDQLKSLFLSKNQIIDGVLIGVLDNQVNRILKKHPKFTKQLQAYTEGLGTQVNTVAQAYLLPEFLASCDRWLPTLPLFGCSSLFTWNQQEEKTLHGRILDFPLVGSYDLNEQAIHYKISGALDIFTMTTAGFPYPSLTAMNSAGVTVAIHQKFSNKFFSNGTPIFYLIFELLKNCDDQKSVKDFINKQQSLTKWAINLSFPNGEVLLCDIQGNDKIFKSYDLKNIPYVYTNNLPLDESELISHIRPFGFKEYCDGRKLNIESVISKSKKSPHDWKVNDMLKILAIPHFQGKKEKLNPFSHCGVANLCTVVMDSKNHNLHFIPGVAPKNLKNEIHSFEDIWSKLEFNTEKKEYTKIKYHPGLLDISMAQRFYDLKNWHKSFHYLQMAVKKLQGHQLEYLTQFFFIIYQYIHLNDQREFRQLYPQFIDIKNKLPAYHQNLCFLFIMRLEKIFNLPPTINLDSFSTDYLSTIKLAKWESKRSARTLKMLRKLLMPRLDFWDVQAPYFRIKDENSLQL